MKENKNDDQIYKVVRQLGKIMYNNRVVNIEFGPLYIISMRYKYIKILRLCFIEWMLALGVILYVQYSITTISLFILSVAYYWLLFTLIRLCLGIITASIEYFNSI